MQFHSTTLFVNDIRKAKDFYTGLLGLEIAHDLGKNVILNAGITLWEIIPGHIINKKLQTKGNSNRFELYFEDSSLDNTIKVLKNAGIPFLHTVREESWGQRTCRFFDPDGHLIEIGEPIQVFIGNMNNKGLNAEQISEKSGVPLETVYRLLEQDHRNGTY
ncbi:MAG: VOC family protein [Candidatus Marinimicrobia bacterium]|nr:VOC family protein [Candidatus Neomarinimicrobiota bacterium]